MKYYAPSHYTGKTKQKKILRIVLLSVLILGILTGLAVLGNLLGERLVRAQSLLDLTPEDYSAQSNDTPSYAYTKPPQKNPLRMHAVCAPLSPAVFAKEETLKNAVLAAAETHAGISVTAADATGLYFAIGDAAENTALRSPSLLGYAADTAASHGMHISATVHTSYSVQQDASILEELTHRGITETVICGAAGETLTASKMYDLLLYLETLRESAPQMTIGIALSPTLFADADAAVHLDTLAAYFDFLLLDISAADSADYAADLEKTLSSLYGSIAYYELAVLIAGEHASETIFEILDSAAVETVRCLY